MDKDRFRRILPKSFEHALEIEKKEAWDTRMHHADQTGRRKVIIYSTAGVVTLSSAIAAACGYPVCLGGIPAVMAGSIYIGNKLDEKDREFSNEIYFKPHQTHHQKPPEIIDSNFIDE